MNNLSRSLNIPPITLNLLIANVVVYLACVMLPIGDAIYHYGMLRWVGNPEFHLYQLFTHMFLHGNFSHLFVNMFGLWMFGRLLEHELGSRRFLIYYFVCGVGAALFQLGVSWLQIRYGSFPTAQIAFNARMLGASGAVMGVVMAFGVLHPNSMIMLLFPPIPMKAKWFVIIYLLIELSLGVGGLATGVAHFAHVGGMLWGWLLLRYWKSKHKIFY